MLYYIKRASQAVFTAWAVITISFVLVRWMPGGPLDYIRAQIVSGGTGLGGGGGGGGGDPQQIERMNELAELYVNINPDEPLYIQYIDYMGAIFQGDLGHSIWYSEPVSEILGPAIPWTIFIGVVGAFISFVSMIVCGSLLAYYEGSNLDFGGTTGLIWLNSTPYHIGAILMLFFFGYQLSLFPTAGHWSHTTTPGINPNFVMDVMHHAALPVISMAWATFGAGALALRANAVQVLGTDYLRVGQLRGLSTRRLSLRYVARNAILPMYTELLIGIGFMFGGAIILETIFQYPGVGYYMYRGIQARDYPLMMGAFILITLAVVIALFVADLTYGIIDPRVKRGDTDEAF